MITELDPVPGGPVAGIHTTRCECGWETVHILPEEADIRLSAILDHLREKHGLDYPVLTCTSH